MRKQAGITVEDFGRALDEFFDEMLISRWRTVMPEEFERSQVIDRPDRYEVRIAVSGVDPKKIEVEVLGQRLCVRASAGHERTLESAYSFAAPIDDSAVEARWSDGVLLVTLPKQQPKRVKVSQ